MRRRLLHVGIGLVCLGAVYHGAPYLRRPTTATVTGMSTCPVRLRAITFFQYIEEPEKKVLLEALANRFGPSGIKMKPEGGDWVVLAEVEVLSAKLSRKITLKQGETVLFKRKEEVTATNLDRLSSCSVTSTDWEALPPSTESLVFSVNYWRDYETQYGKGGHLIMEQRVITDFPKQAHLLALPALPALTP